MNDDIRLNNAGFMIEIQLSLAGQSNKVLCQEMVKFIILNSKFIILNTKFILLNSNFMS